MSRSGLSPRVTHDKTFEKLTMVWNRTTFQSVYEREKV